MADYNGGDNDDTHSGTGNPDIINGNGGNDILNGAGGGDTIHGGFGNDTINGDAGNDFLYGEGGDDVLNGGADDDYIEGGVGDDIDGGTGTDEVYLNLRAMTAASIVNLGLLPNNVVQFGSSTSLIAVEKGRIEFGSGNDQIILGATLLKIYAGDGNDTITGTALDDETYGETGNDTINGLAGNDKLFGGDGDNILDGGADNDELTTGVGVDQLSGGTGNDVLSAGEGADTLNGGDGADTLQGGLGADIMTGGTGDDRYVFGFGVPRSESSPTTVDVITDFQGAGVAGGDLIDLPPDVSGRPLVFNVASQTFVVGATGLQLPPEFAGDGLADVVWQHNAAQNRVEVWVDANDDGQMSEVDMVIYLTGISSLIQGDFVDNFLVWRGTAGNDLYEGNAAANVAYGIVGNDEMHGAGGGDTLYGQGGDDTLYGESGIDTIYGGLDNDTLYGGDDSDNLSGQEGNDIVEGGFGNDTLAGGTGDDTLRGGGDNDSVADSDGGNNSLFGDDGNDTLTVTFGSGTATFTNSLEGGAGDDILSLGGQNGTLTGGIGSDQLSASGYVGAVQVLDGGADNDLLTLGGGWKGNPDALQSGTGGTGADTFVLTSASNLSAMDKVLDFSSAQGDKLVLHGVSAGRASGAGYWGLNNGSYTPSLLFRGFMDASNLVLGHSLPGSDLGTGFIQVWYTVSAGKMYLVADSDGDNVLDGDDFVVEFSGTSQLTLSQGDFVAGMFVAVAGTSGNDTLNGTASGDQLYGGAGDDTINGLDAVDELFGGPGADTIDGGAGADQIFAGDGIDTVHGGIDGDIVAGESGADILYGDAGNDQLQGGLDNDTLYGGDDSDNLSGQEGNDIVEGGFGNDTLYGGTGDDTLRGGGDNDSVADSDGGNNSLFGDDGNDTLTVTFGSGTATFTNSLEGGAGDDILSLGGQNGTLTGGIGSDQLSASGYVGAVQVLDGGADNDLLTLGGGWKGNPDALQSGTGGTGADTFVLTSASNLSAMDKVLDFSSAQGDKLSLHGVSAGRASGAGYWGLNNGSYTPSLLFRGFMDASNLVLGHSLPGSDLGTGFIQVWYTVSAGKMYLVADSDGDNVLDGDDFVVEFSGTSQLTLSQGDFVAGMFVAVAGTSGNDTLNGTASGDQLYGGAGDDTINGLDAVDELFGGPGADTIDGGAGADQIFAGDGIDTVHGGIDGDIVAGESGADILYGDAGNDQLQGGLDNDTLYGGDDSDNLSGQEGNDIVEGGFGNDTLYGGIGDDTLRGGGDNDSVADSDGGNNSLFGDDGNDTLTVTFGSGTATFTNSLEGGAGDDILSLGGQNGTLTGGIGSDQLSASGYVGAVQVLDGGADNDLLTLGGGWKGNPDALQSGTGGTGADTFVLTSASNLSAMDKVLDFSSAQGDKLSLHGVSAGRASGAGYWGLNNGSYTPSLLFRGFMDASNLVLGHSLPGSDLGTGFIQVWYTVSAGKMYLVADSDGDNVLDGDDFVVEFSGTSQLTLSQGDFVAGMFVAVAGTSGNDTLNGTASGDQLYGGAGDDTINGLDAVDELFGGPGADTIDGGAGADQIFAGDGIDTVHGGIDGDIVAGESGADILYGDAGNDQLQGGLDNDTLYGGDDSDNLSGQEGNDIVEGGFGNDTLYGGIGDDTLRGGGDNDSVADSDGGNNSLFGDDGNDTLTVTFGSGTATFTNSLEGGAGDDILSLGGQNGTLTGGIGSDQLSASGYVGAVQVLDGGADNDLLTLGGGWKGNPDALQSGTGGTGADTFVLTSASNLSAMDKVLDFSSAQGDKLSLHGVSAGRASGAGYWGLNNGSYTPSLLFRGFMDASNLVLGHSLPGSDLGTGFIQVWYTVSAGKMYLVADSDGDNVLDGDDFVVEFSGTSQLTLSQGDFIAGMFVAVAGTSGNDTLNGTANNDDLYGAGGDDVVNGLAGIDTINGGIGNDTLNGGDSGDTLRGGIGNDTLNGDAGADTMFGDEGDDLLRGNFDNDTIDGGSGVDRIEGGSGDDTINGGLDNDTLDGGLGNDGLNGGDGSDTADYASVLTGGVTVTLATTAQQDTVNAGLDSLSGVENLTGTSFSDTLTGNDLANVIDGGAGNDTMSGGLGDDVYVLSALADIVVEQAGQGRDELRGDFASFSIAAFANVEDYRHMGAGAASVTGAADANRITGGAVGDTLSGLGGDDLLLGGGGADMLLGGADNDTLDGGTGIDTTNGGAGDDIHIVDSAADVVVETSGNGTDTVRASLSYALGAGVYVEALETTDNAGTGAINLTGNEQVNLITGNAGANILDGKVGADTMSGLGGNDFYYVDNAADAVVEGAGQGTDRIFATVSYAMAAGVQVEALSTTNNAGPGAINLTGNELANSVYGNAGVNVLDGGAGADTLIGFAGNDIYIVDNALDRVLEGASEGADDRILASVSYTQGVGVYAESLRTTNDAGVAAINLTGNELVNFITGNAGANILDGKAGADTMSGLGGNDFYYVDNAADAVVEGAGQGTGDRIFASVSYAMAAGVQVEALSTTSNAGTGALNLTGNEFANALYGNAGANVLDGGIGADTLIGFAGNDTYIVDNALDRVVEGASEGVSDRILASVSYTQSAGVYVESLSTTNNAGTGAINLTGNELANLITGNAGANILDGKGGADTMAGLGGNDFFYVDNAADRIVEGASEGNADRIFASVSYALGTGVFVEMLTTASNAGTAAINLTGNELANSIIGNAGVNILDGKAGADTMVGLGGNDFYYVDNVADRIVEGASEGIADRIFASISYALGAGVYVEILSTGDNGGTAAVNLTGNELANAIYGNAGANILDGKAGADTLIGFGGNDFYYIDNAADAVVEGAGQGTGDRIFASVNYAMAAGVQVEILSTANNAGIGALNLTGNEFANSVYGNAGVNVLDGGVGADTLIGFAGNDIYIVDNALDRVVEGASEGGDDRILASVSYTQGAGVYAESLRTTNDAGTDAINLNGNELANAIYGNAGANILDGKGGADTMSGLGGNDFYYVDNAADAVVEGAGQGTADRIFASVNYAMAAGVQVEILGTANNAGTGALNLTGNELSNTVFGNAGANILDGKAGADTLSGFAGADQFRFTSALGGGNIDRIVDFQTGVDKIALDDAIFTGLPGGSLAPGAFVNGTAAADASDRIIYNAATGALLFDADGIGVGAAIQFATLSAGLGLAASDFMVV